MPAYVPRWSSGIAGCRMVRPLTWHSYSTVSCQGVRSGRSSPHSNHGLVTTERGTNGALLASYSSRSSPPSG